MPFCSIQMKLLDDQMTVSNVAPVFEANESIDDIKNW